MITAMILAGGNGTRVGADRPKQFIEVLGKPILAYTIDIYQKNSNIDSIEIVCHKDWIAYINEVISTYAYSKVKWVVTGGSTFLESVSCGISELRKHIDRNDIVMIHYGAAPFTSQEILNDSIRVCKKNKMSVSCTPCYQLMGSNDDKEYSSSWIDRDKLVQICCPQSFRFSYLLELCDRGKKCGLIESVEPHITSLMFALGEKVYQSCGNQTNIKITTKEDVELFEKVVGYDAMICKNRKETCDS